MKRILTAAACVCALAVPAAASAEYGTQPGYDTAIAQSNGCAGAGAFGAFGTFGDVTHDFGVNNPGSNGKPGADGYQTGVNNALLCGNRQGNL
jgi:opacity protein-like surface antigen